MPLVVPNINSTQGDKNEWLNKLAGKKISESTADVNTFAKKDLPKPHRILGPGATMTMDYQSDRLNIYVSDEGIVHDVSFA